MLWWEALLVQGRWKGCSCRKSKDSPLARAGASVSRKQFRALNQEQTFFLRRSFAPPPREKTLSTAGTKMLEPNKALFCLSFRCHFGRQRAGGHQLSARLKLKFDCWLNFPRVSDFLSLKQGAMKTTLSDMRIIFLGRNLCFCQKTLWP